MIAPGAVDVAVRVAVEDEVEPGARPQLEQVEPLPRPARKREERRQQREAATDLVRLDVLFGDEPRQPVALVDEDVVRRRPRVDPVGEREKVQAAEESDRRIPPHLTDDRLHPPLGPTAEGSPPPGGREPGADVGIQRRAAALARLRLMQEGFLELGVQAVSSADFACSAIAPNACGSLTASSARTFRSSSMSAFFSPAINWLYERPLARAPALIRMIQSRRKVRFFALRSRYAYVRECSTCSFA